jgi:broad specificity phosphatase PhoE
VPIYLVRHGETEWTVSGRHTGRTDIPLSPRGEEQARHLRDRLASVDFDQVVVSPLIRARQTAALAGLGQRAEVAPELREYDYGDFEGWTRDQIEASWPGWDLWRDGCPGGESPDEVLNRARRLLGELRPSGSKDVALFGHGHILRAVAAAYLGQEVGLCRHLVVPVASISILGEEHSVPAIVSWGTA